MAFDCRLRREHGVDACWRGCPLDAPTSPFSIQRVGRDGTPPAREERTIDVAVIDMHHGWPNLGHDALVDAVRTMACDIRCQLTQARWRLRVISYDVRRGAVLPSHLTHPHAVYLGTGGPGHLDPRANRGGPASQRIDENPSWEAPLFERFDEIRADPTAALFAVCHSFGVICRWLGIAEPRERQSGKSVGIVSNVLHERATAHPWFADFNQHLAQPRRFSVLDNRLYDLVPTGRACPDVQLLSYESTDAGEPSDALTMIEVGRGRDGIVPRMLAANHHPEIVDRRRQLLLLERMRADPAIDQTWFDERHRALRESASDANAERGLHLTSAYTLMMPLRTALYEAVRRAQIPGVPAVADVRSWPRLATHIAEASDPTRLR